MTQSPLGNAANRRAAMERVEAIASTSSGYRGSRGGRPILLRLAADKLNERNIESTRRGRWSREQLLRMGRRLGLRHPLAGQVLVDKKPDGAASPGQIGRSHDWVPIPTLQ